MKTTRLEHLELSFLRNKKMKTIDKIFLGILVILVLGINGVMITAFGSDGVEKSPAAHKQLVVKEIISQEGIEDFEEDEAEDLPITGTPLEMASQTALSYIGEGKATDSEIGDEEGYYEIEITLDNGNEIDVHLDENFNVLSTEYEDEEDDD